MLYYIVRLGWSQYSDGCMFINIFYLLKTCVANENVYTALNMNSTKGKQNNDNYSVSINHIEINKLNKNTYSNYK